MIELMRNDLQMKQRLKGGARPYREAANGTVFAGGRRCRELTGKELGSRSGVDDGVVGGKDTCMTGHDDVKDRGAREGRGLPGGTEIIFLGVGIEARIEKAGVRAAGALTVRGGGGLKAWNEDGRRVGAMFPGDVVDVGNEPIGGAEEISERARVVLTRTIGLHDVFGTVADLLLNLEETR